MGQYDITLRHVVQRHAKDFVVGLAPPGFPVESVTWVETQLTMLERRADKALEVRGDGQRQLVKVEFVVDPKRTLGFRMFEYSVMMVISLHATAEAEARRGKIGEPDIPRLKSVAVILSGRAKPWPKWKRYQTSWPDDPFSGQSFQIEAVYQRTVEQLLARPGALWLVFTPLAVDAKLESMRLVLDEIRHREPRDEERAELYAAMLVLAALDPWGHNLREEIKRMMAEQLDLEFIMGNATLREVFEEGLKKGIRRGIKKGIKQGLDEGRKNAIEEMLQGLLTRRLHRALTPVERAALSARASTLDVQEDAPAVLDLDADALLAWLLGPDAE